MTTTPTTAGTPPPGDQPDRATRAAAGRVLTRDATNIWLTDATVADIDQAVAVSISRYQRKHQQQPTWAQALAGVDAELLTPLTVVPPGWPLPPAAWRRDLRTRLMNHLKHTGWITYSTKTRSLQLGPRGYAWLTVTGQLHPTSPHPAQAPGTAGPKR